ncbi:CBL-interacting protein kinase 23 isoform X6 [Cryptomeria japonica]|uniref:CBL-interacting protein kinase 23 isoform X6 n=1 Tax=Cryptomeria japonica TaxID=3369 RepID=UPI0027DA8B96|nr:CBL-interacting protein kinase 23 isoform X6 [Cryptomeria japonica]
MSRQRIRVGKYELGRLVGEGKFSKVKFARNMETGEGVAIKIMERDTLLKQKMVKQIKREISAMNLIKHPNIVRLHEVMASKKRIYIVLEFVMGGDLHDKITHDGRLREDEARKYFQQLITAVDYCHSRGVSHRDLKPENVLLDSYGNLKVSDFGLSALPQQVRRITAPEILQNEWFQKDYIPPKFQEDEDEQLVTEIKEIQPVFMNAFELISMLQVLNFGNMFEQHMGLVNQQTRFTSKHPAKEIITKIDEAAGTLGFNVKKRNFKVKLQGANIGRKGRLSVVIELFEVAPSLCMVEVHKAGGDTLEFSEFYEKLSSALKDIIWKSKVNIGEIA